MTTTARAGISWRTGFPSPSVQGIAGFFRENPLSQEQQQSGTHSKQPDRGAERGVFTHGSTMRHVITMSGTGAVGLVAIFIVDLANLFYISLLGQQELAAAGALPLPSTKMCNVMPPLWSR